MSVNLLDEFINEALDEVEDPDLLKLNQRSRQDVMTYAYRNAIASLTKRFGNDSVRGGFAPRTFTVHVEIPHKPHSYWASFFVDYGIMGKDVMSPVVEMYSGNVPPELAECVEEYKGEVESLVYPKTLNNGWWWGDENMYLKRPMVVGENPTLPPVQGWQALHGETYEPWNVDKRMVKEAMEPEEKDPYDDPKASKITAASLSGMRFAASVRLQEWEDAFAKHEGFKNHINLSEERSEGQGKRVLTFDHHYSAPFSFVLKLLVDFKNPLQPKVKQLKTMPLASPFVTPAKTTKPWLDPGVPAEFLKYVTETLLEVVGPHVREDGLWWGDENFYSKRMIYEGEDLKNPPFKGWTVVDRDGLEVDMSTLKGKYDSDFELGNYTHTYTHK